MNASLSYFINLINQKYRILNLSRFKCPNNFTWYGTYICSTETLQGRGIPVTTQSDSMELSTQRASNRLAN